MAAKRKRPLAPRQIAVTLAAALLFAALCFALERTGVMDTLLQKTGVQDTATPAEGVLEAHFIDVGNADACLVTCGGQNLLIDAGEKSAGDKVVAYLKAHGVERLDYLIATHADADHIGGMRQVVETFPVSQCLMAFMPEGAEPTTSTYINLLTALDKQNVPVIDVKPGEEYALGEAVVTILGPVAESTDKNEQSVVCRVTHGSERLLFVGDAGKEEETTLLDAGVDLRADLLKVGHHGSRGSSTKPFLQAVGARVAVISCGADNSYGHPHQEAVNRLTAAGMTIYRTDQCGTIVARSDGTQITIETER